MGTSVFLQAAADVVVTAPALTAEQLLVQQPRSGMLLSEVIDTMMAALHRTNSDSPDRPYLGCEVALRFLSTTHQAAQLCNSGGPPAFARYMRQPHKQPLATWSEYRYLGSPTVMTDMTTASSGESEARQEAYQQVEVRQNSEVEWSKVRWLLVMEDGAWRVDGVFSEEPDEPDDGQLYRDLEAVAKAAPLDLETQRRLFAEFDADSSGALDEQEIALIVSRLGIRISGEEMHKLYREVDTDGSGEIEFDEFSALLSRANAGCAQGDFAAKLSRFATTESPREVVDLVMRGLRNPNEPHQHAGAAQAVRYCAPTNRASGLTPESFATYLEEPWYRVMVEWEQMEIDEEADIDVSGNTAEVEVVLRRSPSDSPSVVAFRLSRHNARWLIDSLDIVN